MSLPSALRRPRKISARIAMFINSNRLRAEAEAAEPKGLFLGGHPGPNVFPTTGE